MQTLQSSLYLVVFYPHVPCVVHLLQLEPTTLDRILEKNWKDVGLNSYSLVYKLQHYQLNSATVIHLILQHYQFTSTTIILIIHLTI